MIQLIYASQPFGFDGAVLAGILLDARRCNLRDDITGALICRDDLYLQLLEGPQPAVEAAYLRILQDDRHLDVQCMLRRPITRRMFPDWAMRDDPARSWMWTRAEVAAGAITAAGEAGALTVFARLAAEPVV